MNRVVKQPHFLGTAILLHLTAEMPTDKREKILKYIGELEQSQRYFAKKTVQVFDLLEDMMAPENNYARPNCYYCSGQGCGKCSSFKESLNEIPINYFSDFDDESR